MTRQMGMLIGSALAFATLAPANATNTIRNAFTARYPTSTLLARTTAATGSACYVCHQPPNTSAAGNCYKDALTARLNAGRTAAQAIADVENMDSDGDGISNLAEITSPRSDTPGQIGFNPGLIGPTGTDPCASNRTTPVTNQLETPPPPRCVADFDDGSGSGSPDGGVTIDDLLYYLAIFEQGVTAADVDDGSATGTPDGGVTIDDLLYFLIRFEAGC
jgi:hypothetical protein